jgi:hypothetical protein
MTRIPTPCLLYDLVARLSDRMYDPEPMFDPALEYFTNTEVREMHDLIKPYVELMKERIQDNAKEEE